MKRKVQLGLLVCLCVAAALGLTACGQSYETTISLPSGEYNGEQEVVLTSSGSGDKTAIYYTLDGSDPTSKSYEYKDGTPLTISYDSTLKAVTIDDGTAGPIAQADYTIKEVKTQTLSATERQFVANLRGSYELNGNTIDIDSANRNITWSINGDKGSSHFTVTAPDEGGGESGTLTYTGTDGKEKTFTIDFAPSGDNAVMFNGENYNFVG
jgi:major membrane immunogen (membrane-anchored lipoprotein)